MESLERLEKWRKRVGEFLDGLTEKDRGTIKIKTKTGKEFTMGPCLFKPGAESVEIAFNAAYSEPAVTITPSGGYIVKVCLSNADRTSWGLGYGDAGMDGDGNTALKLAAKRARVDAALSFLAASDRLTQDLDDAAYRRKVSGQGGRPSHPQGGTTREKGETRKPTAETGSTWPFGKDKGKDISYISTKSLEWYLEEYEPSKRDTKYAAENATLAEAIREVLRKRGGTDSPPKEEEPPPESREDHGGLDLDDIPFSPVDL